MFQNAATSSSTHNFSQDIPATGLFENRTGPPILPPHLLQVILNKASQNISYFEKLQRSDKAVFFNNPLCLLLLYLGVTKQSDTKSHSCYYPAIKCALACEVCQLVIDSPSHQYFVKFKIERNNKRLYFLYFELIVKMLFFRILRCLANRPYCRSQITSCLTIFTHFRSRYRKKLILQCSKLREHFLVQIKQLYLFPVISFMYKEQRNI